MAVVLIAGNLVIAASVLLLRATADASTISVPGVDNMRVVDGRVLRGDAPSDEGYRNLAAMGVTTVVDLRGERDLDVPDELLDSLGIVRVHLPIRDGQTPSPVQVRRFIEVVADAGGLVYLHCGAGVGRTGSMAAAYLVGTGQVSGLAALERNLAVGPPSLEQIVYAASLEGDQFGQPPLVVKAVSRFLDAPRRIWSRLDL